MKTFKEYINEMSLKSFKTRFEPIGNEPEGFGAKEGGKTYLGSQVINPGGVDDHPETEITGRFSKKDRILLSHPATFQRLEQKLSNSRYDFNIIMMEFPSSRWSVSSWKRPEYEDEVENFIKQERIETNGHITFAKNGTSGHVMTSWMVLHTMGHAAMEFAGNDKIFSSILTGIVRNIRDVKGKINSGPYMAEALKDVFMFESLKSPDPASTQEIIYEIFAEFLWHGDRIRINPNYQSDSFIVEKVKALEYEVKRVLDYCVGNIIYDYYS